MTQQEYDAMMKQYALEQQLRSQYSVSPYNPAQFAGKTGAAQNSSLNNLLGNVGYNPADLFGGNYKPTEIMPAQPDFVDPGNLTQETYGYSSAYKSMFDSIASGVDPKSAAQKFFADNPSQYTDAADSVAKQKDLADMIKLGEQFAADKFKQDKARSGYDLAGKQAAVDWAAKHPKNTIRDQPTAYAQQAQQFGGDFNANDLMKAYAQTMYHAPTSKAPMQIGSVRTVPADAGGTGGVHSPTQAFVDPMISQVVNDMVQRKIDQSKQTILRSPENAQFMNAMTAAYGNPYQK